MVTKEQAVSVRYGQELHYTGNSQCSRKEGPRGGVKEKVMRVRVSGQCTTWKTRPDDFRLPVKYDRYESSAIEPRNAHLFHLPSECPMLSENESYGVYAHLWQANGNNVSKLIETPKPAMRMAL